MHPRAQPWIWDPGWLVLRDMARAIRSQLAELSPQGARVLDFGCGERPYEAWFAQAGARYEGADIDTRHEVEIRADGTLASPDAAYDGVVSFQVLEHVWDVGAYLREARRVLRADGWLMLSTHGSWLYHPHPADYRRWTAEGLRREVEAHGFRLERIDPVVGPLALTTVYRSIGAAQFLKRLPLLGAPLVALLATACNCLAWAEDRVTPRAITAVNACTYVTRFRRTP